MKSLFLYIVFFVAIQNAHASSLADLYKEETLLVLNRLAESGVTEFGCTLAHTDCLSPHALYHHLKSDEIKWKELPDFKKASGATRFSAFNHPPTKTIYLNKSAQDSLGNFGLIGLHEVLGILGKEDRGFQVTTAIAIFLETQNTLDPKKDWAVIERLKTAMKSDLQAKDSFEKTDDRSLSMSEGGAVIVGGGGDTRTLTLRLDLYRALRQHTESGKNQNCCIGGLRANVYNFYLYFQHLPIEISREAGSKIIFEFENFNLKRALIPEQLLETNQQDVIKELVWLYSSFGLGLYIFSGSGLEKYECLSADGKSTFEVERLNQAQVHPSVPTEFNDEFNTAHVKMHGHTCRIRN